MKSNAKFIINAAITGMVPTQHDNPHVPVTVAEIADCVRRVRDAGAALVHLHVRDGKQQPTSDADACVELVNRVREVCPDIIVCVSLSGRRVAEVDRRAAPLASRPELASLTLGSLNLPRETSVNAPETIAELARRIYAAGAVPELEVFETGFINYAKYLIEHGVLRPPYYFNLILGSLGAAPLDLVGLGHMISLLPAGATWSVGGIGRYQLSANTLALVAGGHVRVGLEDNLYYDADRRDPADNVRLVERLVRIGRELGREPASPEEARQIIGLPGKPG